MIANDHPAAFTALREEFAAEWAAEQVSRQSREFSVPVEGLLRNLAPLVGDEVYRIAIEAVPAGAGYGTEAELTIPASFDYAKSLRTCWRSDSRKGSEHGPICCTEG